MAATPGLLSAVPTGLLPDQIIEPIFKKASESSAVMQLARRIPLALDRGTSIPVPMDIPTAGWVSEAAAKPVAAEGMGVKRMVGKKVALLMPVSQEVALTNPAGLYDQLVNDLPTAIGRSFDYAAIHGLDLKSGGAGPFSDYLAATPNSQVIGATASASGGVYADLVKGVQQVVNGPVQGYQFSGFACDPRLLPELMLSTDANGRPLIIGTDTAAVSSAFSGNNLIGFPAAYNTGVSGKYYRSGDAVQVVTINGVPTGGTFTLTIGGATTTALAYNATAATVQSAIQALGTQATANATVSGSAGGPYTVTFAGASGPIYTGNALTGGTSPSVTVAQSPNQDTGLRAIGGDWSQCAYGVGMEINMQVSREASYTPDGGTTWISAFQNNLVLLLIEAYYGFVCGDVRAFVAYTHGAGS